MVTAIKRTVTVQPGGVVEVRSDELPPGASAEVIVLVDQPPTMSCPSPADLDEQLRLAASERFDDDRAMAQEWFDIDEEANAQLVERAIRISLAV